MIGAITMVRTPSVPVTMAHNLANSSLRIVASRVALTLDNRSTVETVASSVASTVVQTLIGDVGGENHMFLVVKFVEKSTMQISSLSFLMLGILPLLSLHMPLMSCNVPEPSSDRYLDSGAYAHMTSQIYLHNLNSNVIILY